MSRLLVYSFLSVSLWACQVHDPSLVAQSGNAEELALADVCVDVASLPVAVSNEEPYEVDLTGLGSNIGNLSACNLQELVTGSDGFLALDVAAGERWHLEAEPLNPEMDVVLFTMDGCGADSCSLAINRCGAGFAEEFTFVTKQAGTYVLGLDSVGVETGEVHFLALRTTCGDGLLDHGEACDDGNLTVGDGCGETCRVELTGTIVPEDEPNNFHTEANAIDLTANSEIVVTGTLGGPCDTDHYAFQVAEDASLQATLLDGAGLACVEGHAPVTMMFMNPSLGVALGAGSTGGAGGACPSIEAGRTFNENLAAGEYHLVMTANGSPDAFDYQLQLTVIPSN